MMMGPVISPQGLQTMEHANWNNLAAHIILLKPKDSFSSSVLFPWFFTVDWGTMDEQATFTPSLRV